jgi:hypothetical protein
MSIDDQDNTRPDLRPPDWTWAPAPAAAKTDRATYEASRRTELDPDSPNRYQTPSAPRLFLSPVGRLLLI